jgi:hypothetical protein
MVTTENTRRAVTLLQEIVLLDRAITSDTAARGRELVEAARLELEGIDARLDALGPIGEVRHTYQPRSTEIDVDVAITTTGRTLAVKVGVAAHPGESDEQLKDRAKALSLSATQDVIAAYAAAGLTFGKVEAGVR